MKALDYRLRELKLDSSINTASVYFGLYRPYIRIVKNGDIKIAKILVIIGDNAVINNVKASKEIGDINPFSNKKNVHFIVNVNFNFAENESSSFKIIEIELKNEYILEEHFNNVNSFMIASCMRESNSNVLGTMTVASYQNGGSFDPWPLTSSNI